MDVVRRVFIIGALIAWFSLWVTEIGAAESMRKMRVTFVAPSISQSIAWLTKETGLFAKHGLTVDVILLTGSPRAIQTLLAGDIDVAIAGAQSALRARMGGADTIIIATTSNVSSQRVMVNPASPLKRLEDVKGKTVGVTQYGSAGDTFLRNALRRVGLRPGSDVTILQMGGTPQVGSALVAGKIDAGVTGESGLLLVYQGRLRQLAGGSAKELKLLSSGATLNTTERLIRRARDMFIRFMRAYVEGIHFFKTDRNGTVRKLQKFLRGASPEQIALLYDDQQEQIEKSPVPSAEALRADLDREKDPKAKSIKPADFVDLSLLNEIESGGFLAELYRGSTTR